MFRVLEVDVASQYASLWWWGGVLQGRTERANGNVGLRSEVWSRDLGLRTIYFQGEAALWEGI